MAEIITVAKELGPAGLLIAVLVLGPLVLISIGTYKLIQSVLTRADKIYTDLMGSNTELHEKMIASQEKFLTALNEMRDIYIKDTQNYRTQMIKSEKQILDQLKTQNEKLDNQGTKLENIYLLTKTYQNKPIDQNSNH